MNKKTWLALPLVSILAACGGGGSGDGDFSDSRFTLAGVPDTTKTDLDLDSVDVDYLEIAVQDIVYHTIIDWYLVDAKTDYSVTGFIQPREESTCTRTGDVFDFFTVNCDFTAISGPVTNAEIKVRDQSSGFDVSVLYQEKEFDSLLLQKQVVNRYQYDDENLTLNSNVNLSLFEKGNDGLISFNVTLKFSNEDWQDLSLEDSASSVGFLNAFVGSAGLSVKGRYQAEREIDNTRDGVEINGAFDFEVMPRSAEAVAMQGGAKFFYKFEAAGKSVCAIPGGIVFKKDSDCDGIYE